MSYAGTLYARLHYHGTLYARLHYLSLELFADLGSFEL